MTRFSTAAINSWRVMVTARSLKRGLSRLSILPSPLRSQFARVTKRGSGFKRGVRAFQIVADVCRCRAGRAVLIGKCRTRRDDDRHDVTATIHSKLSGYFAVEWHLVILVTVIVVHGIPQPLTRAVAQIRKSEITPGQQTDRGGGHHAA